ARVAPVTLWREVRGSLEERNIGAARELAKESDTPLGRMLRSGLLHWAAGPAALSTALEDSGQREADGLQKHLAGLQGIASVAPLLGLLGTVFGMIKSFLSVAKEQALGNPERLAEGIGQALVTTAAGLTVAIPALVLYYLFRGRIRGLVGELDHVARSVTAFRQEGS
ncbi:MAG: MotA/TolQ/ExbB proton channel family protein, partial [Planctomycetota bacterium]